MAEFPSEKAGFGQKRWIVSKSASEKIWFTFDKPRVSFSFGRCAFVGVQHGVHHLDFFKNAFFPSLLYKCWSISDSHALFLPMRLPKRKNEALTPQVPILLTDSAQSINTSFFTSDNFVFFCHLFFYFMFWSFLTGSGRVGQGDPSSRPVTVVPSLKKKSKK